MKSNVWLRLVWMDYQLMWDEADYGGIGVLRLPPDKVWKPDIVLFNKYVYYENNDSFKHFSTSVTSYLRSCFNTKQIILFYLIVVLTAITKCDTSQTS